MKYQELKQELKELAASIRKGKNQRKSSPNGYVSGLDYARHIYRHKHIVYCMLRGKTIEQIEPKVRQGNERCELTIVRFYDQYRIEDKAEVENE